MWNNGMKSQDMGDAMAGVEECLLMLDKLRESTSGIADSSTVLLGHTGGYASAGNRSVTKWWRMAHPSSNHRDDGSGQRVWTKRWRALRHFALDRVDKLMERGLGPSGLVGPSAPGMLAECATAETLSDQWVDGRVVP